MIKRILGEKIQNYALQYPVVTLTGPRQSGKTTLCKMLFPDKTYFSLEDLDVRNFARNDPRGFLDQIDKNGAILDEIQKLPELLSYIQTYADRTNTPGQFILTGSQNFELLNSISQTLAGRTALATLLPFSYDEIYSTTQAQPLEAMLYKGFYPRIHDKKLNPSEAYAFYVSTYLDRDIRNLIHVKDLSKFELFLKLCASRTGQILNLSSIANDCGINHNTVKSWLSVLEASYVIHFVRTHHKNFRKRLVKSPKLYFVDTGLACYLMDIENPSQISSHPLKGFLFETFVVSEILKHRLNQGKKSHLSFFRDSTGNEVDLILDYGTEILPVEIKLGKTVAEDFFKGLRYYLKLNPKNAKRGLVIYGGENSQKNGPFEVKSYQQLHQILP